MKLPQWQRRLMEPKTAAGLPGKDIIHLAYVDPSRLRLASVDLIQARWEPPVLADKKL